MYRASRYRLYPTPQQAKRLEEFVSVCRFVYNLALEHRERMWTYYRDNGASLNYFQQSGELTQLRAQVDWIAAVPAECEQAALKDLDTAFSQFFRGVTQYPRFRRRGQRDSIRFSSKACPSRLSGGRWGNVWLPKVGWVRYRHTHPIRGKAKNVTFTRDALGWHVVFQAVVDEQPGASQGQADVGVDMGVANTIALSTGALYSLPDVAPLERRRKSAQRAVSRRIKGSKRREAAKMRVRSISAKIARIRLDWHHRMSRHIADQFGTVVIEDLNIRNMTASGRGKRGLNRSITHQAWGIFDRLLTYKVEERGGQVIRVNPAYTSQTCSCCGVIDKASRESQAVFACRHCGFTAHADANAATNILRRSTASTRMEEGHHFWPSSEVRTGDATLVA